MKMDPRFASVYAQISGWQKARGLALVGDAAPRGGETVLDVGCGPGELTAELARRVGARGRVLGIDPDEARIALATATFAGALPGLSFDAGRGEAMPSAESAAFDLVFSNYAIQWSADQEGLLDEVWRCLKPGGRIAFEMPAANPDLIDEVMAINRGCKEDPISSLYYVTEEAWRPRLQARGFSALRTDSISSPMPFPSAEAFYAWWEGTSHGAFQRDQIGAQDRRAFEATFVGGRSATVHSVRIFGTKPGA